MRDPQKATFAEEDHASEQQETLIEPHVDTLLKAWGLTRNTADAVALTMAYSAVTALYASGAIDGERYIHPSDRRTHKRVHDWDDHARDDRRIT